MIINDLENLRRKAEKWRASKKYRREPVSKEIIESVVEATGRHSINEIVVATRFRPGMIKKWLNAKDIQADSRQESLTPLIPAYTKVSIESPSLPSSSPIAELETCHGTRLRIYSMTSDIATLVFSLCNGRAE